MLAQDGVSNKFGAANVREEVRSWALGTYAAEGREKDRKEAERLPGIINNAEHHYIR